MLKQTIRDVLIIIIVTTASLVIATSAYLYAVTMFNIEMDELRSEHKCIGVLRGKGYERNEIHTDNGLCWINDTK